MRIINALVIALAMSATLYAASPTASVVVQPCKGICAVWGKFLCGLRGC